ncbi:cation diffusion facilitator family transporter [Bradyrhizobium australiense]|uniref:Cation diffusion facilitator family transporter n=1 Tax=Bradyrhizobium australiense TaxID=2721161 RepID=A0A7Y4LX64_9BRAD|nr:cation diffusion facilitator family transporter [Bradyrhizobium australiense]NOJ42148.1 cation diffusion facilitator family transporter [Bradyrhizobium australiense]
MAASESSRSKKVVYAAVLGNLMVAVTKLTAALLTGSSSMLSESAHSLVDTGNETLLLYGYYRSRLRPDEAHPLGYGRELYFWSFVVALLLFALGAGISVYEGITHIAAPSRIENITVNYVVLALSAVFEGASWWIALIAFRSVKGELSYWDAIRSSKDPPSFMVLLEDTAALIGLCIAALGIFLADRLENPALDGVASILIGSILAAMAIILARENKELLIGERAHEAISSSILALAASQPGVEGANGALTVHLAPDQIVVTLSLEFADDLRTPELEQCVEALEHRIRAKHPEVVSLFVKPQTARTFQSARKARFARSLSR